MMATVGRMFFPNFVVCICEERAEFALSVSFQCRLRDDEDDPCWIDACQGIAKDM